MKALQIDDTLAEAHVLTAAVREFHLDWQGAEDEYKRALNLDPNSVRAHETYAWHLEMFERLDEALSHLKRAQELDPSNMALMWDIGVWFNFSRQHDRAIEQFQKMIAMDPNYPSAHAPGLASSYEAKGMYEQALDEVNKATALGGPTGKGGLGYAYAVAGQREEAHG